MTTLLGDVAHQIKQVAGDADIVGLPAVIGLGEYARSIQTLRRKTGLIIYETPTLPPSILGMRLDEALKSRFAELGGIFIAGDRAISGDFDGARLDHVHSQNYGARRLIADYFVLSSGSFFSGGLTSEFDEMREPVFGLRLDYTKGRSNWSRKEFFHPEGHQFLSRGVRTDDQLRPFDKKREQNRQPVLRRIHTGALRPPAGRQRRRRRHFDRIHGGSAYHQRNRPEVEWLTWKT